MTATGLDGRVVLVTGSGAGIGRSVADALVGEGASVVVADIDGAAASEVADGLASAGGSVAAIECDVTNEAAVEDLVGDTVATFGGLDAAVNNVGIAFDEVPLHETDLDLWERSIRVNLTATFLCMKHEIRYLLDHGGGSVVNLASGAARVPAPGRAPYSAAKRGVVSLTAHGAQDYRRNGIRVNAVLPGMVDTPGVAAAAFETIDRATVERYLPLGRLGEPAEVADVVVWLCGDGSRHVSGQAIVVDGGGILA